MQLYRLDFDIGGNIEMEDLQTLKDIKALSSGTIKALHRTFSVTGDPELRVMEDYSEADSLASQGGKSPQAG